MEEVLAERIERCRQRLAEDPQSGVFVLLADLLRERGSFEEALAVLADGIRQRPESLAARVVMGRTLLETGRGDEARPVLAGVLESDRDNVVALRLLAEDCRSRAAWAAAVPYLERLVELETEDDRWPAALAQARAYRDEPPSGDGPVQAGFATLTLVDVYLAQGYHARAMTALRQMLEVEPEREDVQARLAALEDLTAAPDSRPADAASETLPEPPTTAGQKGLRRAAQKRQFEAWLESIGHNEGEAP
jgi:predicted Zn-dependent protease